MSVPESAGALLERVLARVAELEAALVERDRVIAEQGERIAELERRLGKDPSNSSLPPSSDAPWEKKPAKKRSSRVGSGRKPGKQPGSTSSSRSLIDDPDERLEIHPGRCGSCAVSLRGAEEHGRQRRQVVDVQPAPLPTVTEYLRVSKVCRCCGMVTTPGWDEQGQWLRSVVQGHLAYYTVPGNTDAVATFRTQVGRHWFRALRRRSQRTRLNWARMDRLTKRWLPPARPRHPFPSCASTPEPEAGAQCGNSARWDLCGGRRQRRSLPRSTAPPTKITSESRLNVPSGPFRT